MMTQENEKDNRELKTLIDVKPDINTSQDIIETNKYLPFAKQLQGDITARMQKLNTKKRGNKNIIIDAITDMATIKDSDNILTLSIEKFSELKNGIPTEAWMFFDALMVEYTATGKANDCLLKISIEKYMRLKGLKNKNHTYGQIHKYFKALQKVKFKYSPKNNKHIEVALYGGTSGISSGEIYFRINPDYHKLFNLFSILPYALNILKIKTDKFPHAYYFMKKIQEHLYMNRNKKNKDYISIAALVKASPFMPNYDEIKTRGQIYQRIIKPTKDTIAELERLGLLIEPNIYHHKNTPLPNNELELPLTYGDEESAKVGKTKTLNNDNTGKAKYNKTFLNAVLHIETQQMSEHSTKQPETLKSETLINSVKTPGQA